MQSTTFGHPEGPEHFVVSEQSRGRWRCRDVVESTTPTTTAASTTTPNSDTRDLAGPCSHASPAESPVDDGRSAPHHLLQAGQGSKVDGSEEMLSTSNDVPGIKNTENDAEEQTAGEDLKQADKSNCFPGTSLSPVLDSNSNASPRRLRSRSTKTSHQASESHEDTEQLWKTMRRILFSDVGLSKVACIMVPLTVVIVVMLSHLGLFPGWTYVHLQHVGHWLHHVLSLILQTMVAIISGIIILVAFQGYRLRQWIANVFQLEMRETPDSPEIQTPAVIGQPSESPTMITTTATTAGDGDKDIISNSALARPPNQNKTVEKQTGNLPAQILEKETEPSPANATEKRGTPEVGPGCIMNGEELRCQKKDEVSKEKEKKTDHDTEPGGIFLQGKRYRKAMKNMNRKFLLIRRMYRAQMSGLSKADRDTREVLSRVQLSLPGLEREKQALMAELEAIHKQHEEEKRRNHDLLARLQRLNQQFVRIGTTTPQGSAQTKVNPARSTPSQDPQRLTNASDAQRISFVTLSSQLPKHYQHYHNHQHQQSGRLCGSTGHSFTKEDTRTAEESLHTVPPL